MDELLDSFCSEYYNVGVNFKLKKNNIWMGEAVIIRKDTGEAVLGGCLRVNKDKNKVKKEILNHLTNISDFLRTAPSDWNSPTLKILSRKTRLNRTAMDMALYIDDIKGTGVETELLGEKFFNFCQHFTEETVNIVKDINKLSPQERIDLLTSKNKVYEDYDDPWNADDLVARHEIFSYFINPSSEEVEAHKLHCSKYDNILNKSCK